MVNTCLEKFVTKTFITYGTQDPHSHQIYLSEVEHNHPIFVLIMCEADYKLIVHVVHMTSGSQLSPECLLHSQLNFALERKFRSLYFHLGIKVKVWSRT